MATNRPPRLKQGELVQLWDNEGRRELRQVQLHQLRTDNIKFRQYACVATRTDDREQRHSLLNIVRSKTLSPTDKVVFLGLLGCLDLSGGTARADTLGTQAALARWLEIDAGAISRSLKKLAEWGLVLPAVGRPGWAINPKFAVAGSHKRANEIWNRASDAYDAVCESRFAAEVAVRVRASLPADATPEDVRDAVEEAVDSSEKLYYQVMAELRRLDPASSTSESKPATKRGRGRPRKAEPLTVSASEKLASEVLKNIARKSAECTDQPST